MENLVVALPMVRAHVEGRKAALDGLCATACPYDPFAESAVERAQARMWLTGLRP